MAQKGTVSPLPKKMMKQAVILYLTSGDKCNKQRFRERKDNKEIQRQSNSEIPFFEERGEKETGREITHLLLRAKGRLSPGAGGALSPPRRRPEVENPRVQPLISSKYIIVVQCFGPRYGKYSDATFCFNIFCL